MTLYISSGAKKITLDDYEGRSFEEVKEELIDLGFDEDNIKSELEESDDVSEGTSLVSHLRLDVRFRQLMVKLPLKLVRDQIPLKCSTLLD